MQDFFEQNALVGLSLADVGVLLMALENLPDDDKTLRELITVHCDEAQGKEDTKAFKTMLNITKAVKLTLTERLRLYDLQLQEEDSEITTKVKVLNQKDLLEDLLIDNCEEFEELE